ncbi:MAG: trehalose-phosphatase [Hyphomonas sp.]
MFLDFDGTLAGLRDDPDAVHLAPGLDGADAPGRPALDGALAVISGRDAGDLARRVPGGLWRIGNHGLILLGPGEVAPEARAEAPWPVRQAMDRLAEEVSGTRVEVKGPILALHYRQVPEAGPHLAEALGRVGFARLGYKLQSGKLVFEAKPEGANKGKALARMMQDAPFAGRRAVMIGDDTTDEDAFTAANALGGLTIKVGEGKTAAQYRLAGVEEVHMYLGELAGV